MTRFLRANPQPRALHKGRITPKTPKTKPDTPEVLSGDIDQAYDVDTDELLFVQPAEVVSSMDSALLPGVFDCNPVILRYEFDSYCTGFSEAIDILAEKSHPSLELVVVNAFTAHIASRERDLKRTQIRKINECLGINGLVKPVVETEKSDALTPNAFLHALDPRVPEDLALQELKDLVGTYRERANEVIEEKSGLSYDEADVAKIMVKYIEDKRSVKVFELKKAFEEIELYIDVQKTEEEDGIRLLWSPKDPTKLSACLAKTKRLLRRLDKDFEGWYLEDLDDFLTSTFNWTNEQSMQFMAQYISPMLENLAYDIRLLVGDLNARYQAHQLEEALPAISAGKPCTSASECLPAKEEVIHISHLETYDVVQDYPWLKRAQNDEPKPLLCYEVNGHGKVYVATALSDRLEKIANSATGTLLDKEVFEDLLEKAIKGIASGKPYKNEKATSKGMAKSNPTPYDNFTIHKEVGGSGGNASRLYFVHTRLSRVVESLPSGVDPEGHLIVVIAKTDKDWQDTVLEIINGSPRRTAKRRGAGN